jgi:hypothetical protein
VRAVKVEENKETAIDGHAPAFLIEALKVGEAHALPTRVAVEIGETADRRVVGR